MVNASHSGTTICAAGRQIAGDKASPNAFLRIGRDVGWGVGENKKRSRLTRSLRAIRKKQITQKTLAAGLMALLRQMGPPPLPPMSTCTPKSPTGRVSWGVWGLAERTVPKGPVSEAESPPTGGAYCFALEGTHSHRHTEGCKLSINSLSISWLINFLGINW